MSNVKWADEEKPERKKRKVRSGATHNTQEQLSMQRSKAFAKRVARMNRLMANKDHTVLISKPKAPGMYPLIKVRALSKKAKFNTNRGVA